MRRLFPDDNRHVTNGITSAACGLFLLASNPLLAKDPCYKYSPRVYSNAAKSSLDRSLDRQVAEGRVLSQTLWNHHFYEDSSILRPTGRQFLERLVRKYPNGFPEVYLQSAQDVLLDTENGEDYVLDEGRFDEYFAKRKELDAERIQAVNSYIQRSRPGQAVVVQIHNRPTVGISSQEVIRAQAVLRGSTTGFLPASITTSSFYFGDAGGGPGGGGGPSMDMGGPGGPGGLPPSILSGGSGIPDAPDFGSDIPMSPQSPTSPAFNPPGGQGPPPPPGSM